MSWSNPIVMNRTFWVGTYPGLTEPMRDYNAEAITNFLVKPTGLK